MPIYEIEAPDGRIFEIEGDTLPTSEQLKGMFSKLQPIEQPKQDNILSGIQSEETRAGLREKGKIGVIEELGRGKFLDVIPFANLVTAMERNDTVKNIDKYLKGGKLTDEEQVNIIDYMYEKTEEQERGYTFGGKIAKGYKAMIPFMFEFMGGGAVGKKAVSYLPKAVSKTGKVGTFLAREGARTLAMPQSIYRNFVDRKLEDRVMLSDKGYLALKESDEKPALTTLKALGDVMIENVSESTGEVLFKPIFGGAGKYIGRKLPTGLAKGFKELSEKVTNLPFSKAVKNLGYDGLLEEIGEERLGDLLRFAVNLEGEGYSLESLSKAIPSFDDMMVEAGVIMTWGGTMRGGQYLASKMIKQGTPKAQAEAIVNDMTPQEITDMIQNPPIAEEVSMLEDSYIEARENLKQKMVDVGFDTDGAEDIQKLLDSRVLALSEAVGVAPIDIVNQWGLDIVQSTNEVENADRNKKIWELVREEGYTKEEAVAEVGKDVLKQFVGEKANMDKTSLSKAKELYNNSEFNKEKIRKETGWFKGLDGKWRFEISDAKGSFNVKNLITTLKDKISTELEDEEIKLKSVSGNGSLFKKLDSTLKKQSKEKINNLKDKLRLIDLNEANRVLENEKGLKLADIYSHDSLFKVYPQLANTEIVFFRDSISAGYIQEVNGKNVLGLNTSRFTHNEEIKDTLVHEIQHLIQDIEGFSRGASPRVFFNKEIKEKAYNELIKSEKVKLREKLKEELLSTTNNKENIEPFMIFFENNQKELNVELAKKEPNFENVDLLNSQLTDELEKIGYSPDEFSHLYTRLVINNKNGEMDNLTKEEQAYNLYKRVYGEVEARNTAKRSDFSKDRIKSIPPEITQDIEDFNVFLIEDVIETNVMGKSSESIKLSYSDSNVLKQDDVNVDYNAIINSEDYKEKINKSRKIFDLVKQYDNYATINDSINRVGGVSSYINANINGENITIRLSDHDTNYDLSTISAFYGADINKFKTKIEELANRKNVQDKKDIEQKKEYIKYIQDNIKDEHKKIYFDKGLEGLKEALKNKEVKPIKFTFKEEMRNKTGKLGLTWSDVKEYIEKSSDVLKQDDVNEESQNAVNSEGQPIAKDKQSLDNFNNWFKDSKVVDEAGNPLVVYHGTDAEFNEFKDIGVGRRILGDGFYFSDNIDVAKQHAKRKGGDRIISSYLNFKNPKLLTWEEARNYKKDSLISEGYDGKIVTSLDGKKIYIAFNPNQIKSVKNVGEFSKETGDIYKQDSRGQIEFTPDKTTIKLMEKADRSTILHEFGHLFMRDILSYNEKAPNERLVKELNAIRDFVGNDGGDFTVEQQETFSRGFEAYLMRGEAPTPQMQGIFDKFKLWLQSVYNSMKELDVKLNKQAINMFDDLFLTQSDIKKKYEVKGKESVEKLFDVQLKLNEIDFDGNKEVKKIKDILDKMLQSNINIDVEFDVEGDIIKDTISLKEAIKQFNQFKKAPKGKPKITLAQYLRNPNNIAFSRQWVERGLQRKGEFEALGIKTYVKKPMHASSWITSEDTFIQELIDAGYIPQGTELSDTFALDDALYNAEITYATNEKTIDRDLKQANLDGLSETISVLESSLEVNFESFIKQVKNLKLKGFNIVESEQLKEIYKSFKDTVNKKEKLSKLNFDNLAKAKGQINSFITNANLSFKGKADLFKKVSAIKDISQYNERIPKILNCASELIENELKDKQVKFIKKILKSYSVTTDKQGIKRSKLDVGTQKIVNDLIDINSLDINQAEELYLNIGKDEIYSDYELLRNKMITYRFKGFDSPASLLQSLSNDLNKLIELGKTAKTEKDTLNRLNRITEVIDFNMGINRIKADVDTVKTKIANIYRTGFTNIYSALNSVAGKKIADEYGNKLELGFSKMFTDNYKHDKRANKEIAKILDVKENQIAETLIDYGKEDYKLVSKKGVTYKLNKMMIIDIYNAIKQKDIRDDYFEHYNKDDILALIGNLTDKDKALGDYLAKEVQSYYDIMNDAVVDIYGTALPKVKNYWSSSVENVKDINLVSQFELTSQLPSALKSRMGSRVPVPSNAWNKYTSYVTQANYMKNVGREFRDVSLLLNDSSVTRNIINKFGDTVRNNISNLMEGMSLKGIKNIESSLNGIVNTVLNNWVTAKIGLNPSVFVKQLGSVTNYAENMPVKEWGKLFLEGLSKPKETVKFMFDNVEYLQARFNKGYSEEITRAIASASKLSAKKQSLTSVMTSLTRFGDIGAIIFGGYPKLKYDLKQGKSIAEAVDSFVLETIKSQQSGLQSSLSVAQQSKNGFMRMLFAFKNTPAQYMRKIADTILQYQNGDISKEQMQKSLVNYLVVQPAIYSWIGSLMVGRFFDDDEEFASFKDLMATLLSQPFSAIPFLDDISKYLASCVVGNKQWKVFNNSFLADIENTLRKTGKDDITIEDLVDIVGTGAELGVGIPVKTVNRWLKRLTGVEE